MRAPCIGIAVLVLVLSLAQTGCGDGSEAVAPRESAPEGSSQSQQVAPNSGPDAPLGTAGDGVVEDETGDGYINELDRETEETVRHSCEVAPTPSCP